MSPQIQEIIALKLSWEQLTPEQKALFNNSQENFKSLTSNFETGAIVDAALLENLVNQMNEDLDLKASLPNYSTDQQKLIIKLVKIRREQIRLEQIQKEEEALNKIKPEINKLDPKQDPRQKIIEIAHQVIPASSVIPAQAGIQSVNTFINICLTSNLDLSDPKDLDLAVSIALGKNKLYEKISKAITLATDQDYQQATQNPDLSKIIDPQTNIVIDTSKIPSPNQVKPVPTIKITPANSDICDTLSTEINKLHAIGDNPKALVISRTLITQISDKQLGQITRYMDPSTLQQPTQSGQQAAAIIKQFPNSSLSPQVIKLYSQGLIHQQWTKIYQKTQIPPRQAYEIHQQLKSLDNSQLGKEITQPLGKVGRFFQTFTNKISGKLPQSFTRPLNYIFHPIQSIKGWLGKKTGQYIGKKLTNKTAKLVAKTLLSQGLKKGAETLIKLGLKQGLSTIITAGIIAASGGILAPFAPIIDFAVKAVIWVAQKTIGLIYNGIQNMAQSIWGEKIKARDLIALPVAAAASFGAILAGLGTATVAAASSAAGTIVASAVAGVFIYIVAFTVAPLISTIAQLESNSLSAGISTTCANSDGIFIYQCDPAWSHTFCAQCSTSHFCNICHSGCGTAAMTMILNAFGTSTNVIDVWHDQHTLGGYAYTETAPPYTDCATNNSASIQILTNPGLSVAEITLSEIDSVLENCGLILATGRVKCSNPLGCGHLIVIIGHNGNNITTLDSGRPDGDHFVHKLNSTYSVTRVWSVVP